jgi:hypothetical protein
MTDAGALRIATPTFDRTRFPPEMDRDSPSTSAIGCVLWIYPIHYPTYSGRRVRNSRAPANTDTRLNFAFGNR